MIKFLYGTDFHGNIEKFETILSFAVSENINLIHLGADILPKGSGLLEIQKKFVNGYLKDFHKKCLEKGISILSFFGNDDIYSRKKYFKKYGTLLDEVPFQKDGYEFKAYPYVQDYPFSLKTSCKFDYRGWNCPDPYIGAPVDLDVNGGLKRIEDIKRYFDEKGTIEEDLNNIHASNKTIMAIHQPPYSVNLDVCYNNRRVGSKAVYDWIEREQPLLVLSGHIHENYEVIKTWYADIGKTRVIQPGQSKSKTNFVVIEIDNNKINPMLVVQ